MNWKMFVEPLGLVASALVAASMTMRNIKILRIINFTGSLTFVVYGILIRSPSVILLNLFTMGVNTYHLIRLRRERLHQDNSASDSKEVKN